MGEHHRNKSSADGAFDKASTRCRFSNRSDETGTGSATRSSVEGLHLHAPQRGRRVHVIVDVADDRESLDARLGEPSNLARESAGAVNEQFLGERQFDRGWGATSQHTAVKMIREPVDVQSPTRRQIGAPTVSSRAHIR